MKLDKLRIKNFKGIRDFTLTAGCKDIMVLGDNATGKTTIADSISWLLFDKDTLGAKEFEIKTLDSTGVAFPMLDHEVEATFINGTSVKLKKIYVEKYTRKRGSAIKEFTGHETEYYFNDVPITKGGYQDKVAAIGVEETLFKLLTNPHTFAGLKWSKQREILLEVCGNVTDEEVVSLHPDLAALVPILDGKTCDEYKAIVSSRKRKINETLNQIPGRVDEAERSKPTALAVTNPQAIIDRLTKLRAELDQRNQEIATIRAGGGIVTMRERLMKQEEIIGQIKRTFSNQTEAAISKKRSIIDAMRDREGIYTIKLQDLLFKVRSNDREIDALTEKNNSIKKEWYRVNDLTFTGSVCPTCNQELPPEKLEKARGEFNLNKSTTLEKLNSEGKGNRKTIDELTGKNFTLQGEIASLQDKIEERAAEKAKITSEIDSARSAAPDLTDLVEYKTAVREKEAIEEEITSLQAGNSSLVEKAEAEKAVIEEQIALNNQHISAVEALRRAEDRIRDLKKEERQLADEFSELEKALLLIETFTREKVSMLDEKINGKFKFVRFKMYEEQINGGLTDTCVLTVDGVPYGSLNNAARIQAGLDIIRTISDHHNFRPLIIVDNRESITSLPEMDTQVISLVVSEAHKDLTVNFAIEQ